MKQSDMISQLKRTSLRRSSIMSWKLSRIGQGFLSNSNKRKGKNQRTTNISTITKIKREKGQGENQTIWRMNCPKKRRNSK